MSEYLEKEIVVDYLRNKLCSKCQNFEGWTPEECKHCLATEAIYSIKMANAAPVKPVVRGEWIKKMEICDNGRFKSFTPHWYCPTCGQEYDGAVAATIIKYCFNCGTEMRKEENDE